MRPSFVDTLTQDYEAPAADVPPATLPHPGLVVGPLMDAVADILHAKAGMPILLQFLPQPDGSLPGKDAACTSFWGFVNETATWIAASRTT